MGLLVLSIIIFINSFICKLYSKQIHNFDTAHVVVDSWVDSSLLVNDILVYGNNKTEEFVIRREMCLHPGSFITRNAIEYDKKRIYSLQLFNDVEIKVEPTDVNKANLIVFVYERWYIYPFPILGFKDRDWNKLFFGAGLINLNFRGRNEKIFAIGTLGYEPSLFLYYQNPQIHFQTNTFLETSIGISKTINKSPLALQSGDNFSLTNVIGSIKIGRKFGRQNSVWAGLMYQVISVSNFIHGRLLNPWAQDAFPIVNFGYQYDTRDLVDYSMYGTLLSLQMKKFGLLEKNIDYWRYFLDYRRFIPIHSSLTFALRSYTSLSTGYIIPSYNHVYLGYSERIRGHFYSLFEGENILLTSMELRYFILSPVTINVKYIPIPEFSVWKFGIAAVIFADGGMVWFNNQLLSLNKYKRGYGTGLNILLPYSFVMRLEYAINDRRKGEFIADLSATF